MSANLEAKKVIVEDIKSKIQASKSVVLVNYKGLTVAEDTELRNEFRKNNVHYKVFKNTLVRKAFNELGVTALDNDLNGTTAIAFGDDETSAPRVVVENGKKLGGKLEAKSGYVNAEVVDKASVEQLASIPSKDALYGILAGTLNGLIGGLARAINKVAEQRAE